MTSWRRRVGLALWAYAWSVTAALVAEMVVVIAARALGHDPRTRELDSIRNLRRVDGRVWAGGQPDAMQYRLLAEHGVRLVVDLRTGARDDPREDDPQLLRSLDVDYVSLPVVDGRAPAGETVQALVTAVASARGLVYLHCGGGVGRSTAVQGAYLVATRREVRRLELLAVGPMTLEQLWYVAFGPGDAGENRAVGVLSAILDAPRRLRSRIRAARWRRGTRARDACR